jgi:hypothetical protein
MVAQGNDGASMAPGRPQEELATLFPARFFQPLPLPEGDVGHIASFNIKGNIQRSTQPGDKTGVFRAFGPQRMIQVGGIQGKPQRTGRSVQQMKKGDGIGSAGKGYQHPVSG